MSIGDPEYFPSLGKQSEKKEKQLRSVLSGMIVHRLGSLKQIRAQYYKALTPLHAQPESTEPGIDGVTTDIGVVHTSELDLYDKARNNPDWSNATRIRDAIRRRLEELTKSRKGIISKQQHNMERD